jgi:tight adherence protein C
MTLTPLLLIAAFLLFFAGIFALIYAIAKRRLKLGERIALEAKKKPIIQSKGQQIQESLEKVVKPLGEMIPRSPEDLSKEESRLIQAGIRRKDAVIIFYGVRVGLIILMLAVLAVSGYLARSPFLWIVVSILAGALVPDLWLNRKIGARQLQIQNGLPDVMDLSVICVEAGLGLDQTLGRIGREIEPSYPALSEELRLYGLEVGAGRSRADALRNLGGRAGVDDLKALAAVLIQADRFGSSIAQSLRVFSDGLRTKRRQRAEETAAKMTVKMIPPMVVFIFPAIFVVVAGPAVVTIVNDFFGALGGG